MSTKPLLSLEKFSEIARNTPEGSSIIREYVARHMAALKDCGTLQPIEGLDAYRINFISQWNQWISGDDSPACVAEALRPFLNFAEELLLMAHLRLKDGQSCEKTHAIFVEAFANGMIPPFHLNAELYSFETGETARLRLEQWKPRIFRADYNDIDFGAGTEQLRHTLVSQPAYAPLITLEVTESRLMRDPLCVLSALTKLHLGSLILSIDDFGTGHASLAQLRDIPFDEIKIDRGFISDVHRNDIHRAIYQGIISMARGMGIRTVAEGVETADEFDFLRKTGCDYAQGYLMARPMSADDILSFAKNA